MAPSSSSSSSVKSQSQCQSQSQDFGNDDDVDVDVAGSKQKNIDTGTDAAAPDNKTKTISTTNVTSSTTTTKKKNDHTDGVVVKTPSSNNTSNSNKDHYYAMTLFGKTYEYTLFTVWRITFYLLMAYSWHRIYLGPLKGPWYDSMTYDHAEFVYDIIAPKTHEETERLRWFGVVMALLSTVNNQTTILFAVLTGQHIFTSLIMFINHHYLFFLLSTLMAFYCNCSSPSSSFNKIGWLHALRGQIVVVYAFASLWKFDIDWIDGTIVKNIFLSLEEQGANRGIPWKALYDTYGEQLFIVVAVGGVFLDTMLFLVLFLLKPGNPLQSLCIVFHGFTGYTMSQRIGYAFPIAMILASLLFQPSPLIRRTDIEVDNKEDGTDQQRSQSCCGDTLSHGKWLLLQISGGSYYEKDQGDDNDDEDEDYIPDDDDNDDDHNINEDDIDSEELNKNSSIGPTTSTRVTEGKSPSAVIHKKQRRRRRRRRRRHTLPLLWLLLQWVLPLRMPFVSNMEYKHTFEGYRWSWTMMLHDKSTMHSPGLSYMTLRPECHGKPYPNPTASTQAFSDIHSFSYEEHMMDSIRTFMMVQYFVRQLPKVFHEIDKVIGTQCTNGQMVMKTAYFSSTNHGPYHRIVDPTVDLLETYRTHRSSKWQSKFWYALIERAPPEHEFVLRGTGSINSSIPLLVGKEGGGIGGREKDKPNEITFIDRSSCLQVDPIRIHSNHFTIQFDSTDDDDHSDSGHNNNNNNHIPPLRLLIRGCPELNLHNCQDIYLTQGETRSISALRTITIGIDQRRKLATTCSESIQEDIVIKLTQIQKPPELMQQLQEQMQQQQQEQQIESSQQEL